jgi:hypothetical protein
MNRESPMPRPPYISPSADVRPCAPVPRKVGRPRKPLDLDGERVKAEREEFRRKELAAIQFVDPACEVDCDPPVKWVVPKVVADDPTGIMIRVARKSGQGLSGSELIAAARSYDGTGAHGGEPAEYVSLFVAFYDNCNHRRRTIGVALHGDELRVVAQALVDHADRLGVPK